MAQVRLYPDLVDVLRGLHHGGWRQGVVSSNSEENIRICLRSHAVEPCFEFVRGYSRLWGKSQALRRVLRGAALDPREVLYVGDEVRDIAAAQDVGIAVAAVTWGIHSKNLLAQHAPTHLIDYPCQLLELLENQLV
jgi:phosphoglycolate phosphatase-like HAD superfamily hydrolase